MTPQPDPNHATRTAQAERPSSDLFTPRGPVEASEFEKITRPSISYWRDAWIRLCTNKVAIASAILIVLLALASIFVPMILPYSYRDAEIWNQHAKPNRGWDALVVESLEIDYTPLKISPEQEEALGGVSVSSFEVPPAPQNVRAVGESGNNGVVLQWDPVAGTRGYRIYRSINPESKGIPLSDVPADTLSYFDRNNVEFNIDYTYRILCYNAFEESEIGEGIVVTPQLVLTPDEARKHDPTAQIGQTIKTRAHYLGTDYLGRDMLARLLSGARISLFIGFGAPLIYLFIGVVYGSIAGYVGRLTDDIMMRIADIVSTVPELLTVIMVQVVLGGRVISLIIALVVSAWARSARQIRGQVLQIREMEYVQAAQILGTSFHRIIGRHLLPNVMGTIIVLFTLAIPQAIFAEAFLSFVGLGISAPLASWGTIAQDGSQVFLTYPRELLIPAAIICVTMLAFNLLGDGLRDALDPKLRGTE